MTKLSKITDFTLTKPKKETPLDKTTRIVRRITEDEAEIRHLKTSRLRKARFESEADALDNVITVISSRVRKRH
jgi:hypothetical protein